METGVEEWACSLLLLVSYGVKDNDLLSKHHPLHTQLETMRFSLIRSLGSFSPWSVGCNDLEPVMSQDIMMADPKGLFTSKLQSKEKERKHAVVLLSL